MAYPEYLESSASESSKAWALVEFAPWCWALERNLANSISRKIAAVQYLHRLEAGIELPVSAPVVQCALKIFHGPCGGGNPRRTKTMCLWRFSLRCEEMLGWHRGVCEDPL